MKVCQSSLLACSWELSSTWSQNTTQKSISIVFCVSVTRHSASTVNRSSHPPGRASFSVFPGGLLLFTVLAEWRIMTNRAYAKNNGDGLLCSILWHGGGRRSTWRTLLNMVKSMAFYKDASNCYYWLMLDQLEHSSYDSCQIKEHSSDHVRSRCTDVLFWDIFQPTLWIFPLGRNRYTRKNATTFGRTLNDSQQESNRRPLRWKAFALIIARPTPHGMALLLCSRSHN